MFSLDPNILISILIITAILVYIFILRKLGPEKILARMTSNKTSGIDKPKEEYLEEKEPEEAEETWKSEEKEPEEAEETWKSEEKEPEEAEETWKSEEKEPEEAEETWKSEEKEPEEAEEKKGILRRRKKRKKHIEDTSDSSVCLHEFGYLGTLPKNASIPDECLGCTRIIDCLAQK